VSLFTISSKGLDDTTLNLRAWISIVNISMLGSASKPDRERAQNERRKPNFYGW
jgi:hypothetical protein